ncbi:mRNA capping enzyme-domain-containing protein [Lenzites betulinus]|nr:mRNA capping enzyme-domain-containing protein [Lenzites betulinus]
MPAFDPVRDAVLNSPITSSHPLPSAARSMHIDIGSAKSPVAPHYPSQPLSASSSTPGYRMSILTSPTSATTSPSEPSPGAALVSPLTRRATDLSMLLNSDPPPPTPLFTPTTPRAPATLSHLLLPDSDDSQEVEQLSHSTPLRRRSSAATTQSALGGSGRDAREPMSYFTHPGSINARPSSSSSSVALGGPVRAMERPQPREMSGLALPGGPATTATMATASPALALPGGAGSRPSSSVSGAGPGSRPSSSGASMPLSANASMPPPPKAPHRSPLVSTASLPSAPMAPPSHPQPTQQPHIQMQTQVQARTQRPRPVSPRAPVSSSATPAPARTTSPATQRPPAPRPRTGSGSTIPQQQQPQQKEPPSLPPPTSSLPPKPMPPPPSTVKRSAIPYAPRRITPATSVLIPLSPAEMERYRNYTGGVGTMILRKQKRIENLLGDGPLSPKREREDDTPSEESPAKKPKTDVAAVVQHCAYPTEPTPRIDVTPLHNARPDVGVAQRQDSPIIGLKSFNNWVKSVLITRFAHPALAASPTGQRRGSRMRGRVLDMGCGKGGDLTKWAKANVAEYVGLDIAAVSIDQARHRHATSRGARFVADFFALDCYSHVLSDSLPPTLLATPFDVVSMQFCMHYAFESETKARTMLKNVASWLRPSGVFVGTIPNAKQLMEQLDGLPKDAEDLSWGNSVYKIRFEQRDRKPIFGHRYWFYLQDAVDDVPEYVVHWDNFVQLASEYDLFPIYKGEFHDVFNENHEHDEFGPLLQRMHVVDSNGESQMDEDQWEAANIYIGFALEKR